MRIRKYANLSSIYSREILQTYVCKLNQSPWDVIPFSEQSIDTDNSLNQFYREIRFTPDEKVGEKIDEVGSDALLIERKTNSEAEKGMENQVGSNEGEKILRCSKSDSKGWQCKNESKRGHTLCNHHLHLLQSCNSRSTPKNVLSVRKSKNATVRHGQTRAAKKVSTSASNPYDDFYYYTGFGPYRGKNRGEIGGGEANKTMEGSTGQNNNFSDDKQVICIGDEVDNNKDEKNDEVDNNKDEKNDEVAHMDKKNNEVADDDGNKKDNNRRKRKRKPVKARSLLSIM
ncbi:hypothetical protein ACOSP7_016862 [Xanthoceras sorbifolium]